MFSLPRTKSFKLGVLVAILEAFSAIALIATSAYLISRASEQPPVLYLMIAVVGVRAFALGRAFFRYVQRLALHDATFTHTAQMRPVIFEKLAQLSPSIRFGDAGQQLARITDQVDELQNYPIRVFTPLIQALSALVMSIVVIGIWFPISALGVFVLGLISLGLSQLLVRSLATKSERLRFELGNKLRSELVEYLQSAELIESYDWGDQYRTRLSGIATKLEQIDSRAARGLGSASAIYSFFAVVAASFSGYLAVPELESVPGHLLAVAVLTPLALFELLAMAGGSQLALSRYQAARDDLNALIKEEPADYLAVKSGEHQLTEFHSLEASGTVEYGTRSVSLGGFQIARGEFVVVTGPSGSGKSTLGYVLGSLHQISGDLKINGESATQFSLESKRKLIGLSEQRPQLFPGTISVNLAVSGVSDEGRQRAILQDLGLFAELEDRGGLELVLGERGSGLSGGQAQRLTIARALLAGAQVLVLDEPTSGLDWENSMRLIDVLMTLKSKGVTIVLITHDRQLVKFADREFVIG